MRKFYIKDFEGFLMAIRKRKSFPTESFMDMLHQYIKHLWIDSESSMARDDIGNSIEDLVFHLGSLMYPKKMIACMNPSSSHCIAKTLRKDLRENPKEQRHIIRIYHFLYRFSLERL